MVHIILTHSQNLQLHEKNSFISALDYLTYYNAENSRPLINNSDFLDYLRF